MKKGTQHNMCWIDVNDKTPEHFDGFRRYRVKVVQGSITPKIIEKTVLGKHDGCGFRFMVGDWSKVTHWKPEREE